MTINIPPNELALISLLQTCVFLLHNFETMEWQIISQHTTISNSSPGSSSDASAVASSTDKATPSSEGLNGGSSTPGELSSDVDAKGFEVKNAVLVNATLGK